MYKRLIWSVCCTLAFVALCGFGTCAPAPCSSAKDCPLTNSCNTSVKLCENGNNSCVVGEKRTCYKGPSHTIGLGVCRAGTQVCDAKGKWGACSGAVLASAEVCDRRDNDCDGKVDEGCPSGHCSWFNNKTDTKTTHELAPNRRSLSVMFGFAKNDLGFIGTQQFSMSSQRWKVGQRGFAIVQGRRVYEVVLYSSSPLALTEPLNVRLESGVVRMTSSMIKKPDCIARFSYQIKFTANGCREGEKRACHIKSPCGIPGTEVCRGGRWVGCSARLAKEVCGDKKDNDCDGQIDEGCPAACVEGASRTCYNGPSGTAARGTCKFGVQRCIQGKWSVCQGEVRPRPEICDGKDNDCDGKIDESGCGCTPGQKQACYAGPKGTQGTGACRAGVQACSSQRQWGPCLGQILPRTETCNRKDDDCDGQIDENVCSNLCRTNETRTCYTGPSGVAGVGSCKRGVQTCSSGQWGPCRGEVLPSREVCSDGKDNDCDGKVDENCPGVCTDGQTRACPTNPKCKNSVQRCQGGQWSSCGKPIEICSNKIDDDCDGQVDEAGCSAPIVLRVLSPPESAHQQKTRLSVFGTSFLSGDKIVIDGTELPTLRLSRSEVYTQSDVPMSLLAPGFHTVLVRRAHGFESNPKSLFIYSDPIKVGLTASLTLPGNQPVKSGAQLKYYVNFKNTGTKTIARIEAEVRSSDPTLTLRPGQRGVYGLGRAYWDPAKVAGFLTNLKPGVSGSLSVWFRLPIVSQTTQVCTSAYFSFNKAAITARDCVTVTP